MIQLCGMTPEQMAAYMAEKGQSAFRGEQLAKWVWAGADIAQMSNLPAALRDAMGREAVANPVKVCREAVSQLDGTRKFLFQLLDGNLVEGVLMRYKYGYTLCLSTQVGCRMGCAFLRLHPGGLRPQPDRRGDGGAGAAGQPGAAGRGGPCGQPGADGQRGALRQLSKRGGFFAADYPSQGAEPVGAGHFPVHLRGWWTR